MEVYADKFYSGSKDSKCDTSSKSSVANRVSVYPNLNHSIDLINPTVYLVAGLSRNKYPVQVYGRTEPWYARVSTEFQLMKNRPAPKRHQRIGILNLLTA